MTEKEIPLEVQQQILANKIALWKNTIYDCQLDAGVAEAIGDDTMKKGAAERLKRALKALDVLEKMAHEPI